mgnify:CR=1 FL=1
MQLMNLKTKYLGKKFEFYKIIDSTQNEIWRRIKRNQIENGTLIMADIQTNGVGTHGRVWYTDETENIAFSIFLETNCFNQNIEGITTEIAEILVQIFKRRYIIYAKGVLWKFFVIARDFVFTKKGYVTYIGKGFKNNFTEAFFTFVAVNNNGNHSTPLFKKIK